MNGGAWEGETSGGWPLPDTTGKEYSPDDCFQPLAISDIRFGLRSLAVGGLAGQRPLCPSNRLTIATRDFLLTQA